MKNNTKGKKGQICQLVDPITQEKQWINLEDIIIYPNNKPIKLGAYINSLETDIINLKLELNKANEDIITSKGIELKLNDNIAILLKKYDSLENSVNTLLSLTKNNK